MKWFRTGQPKQRAPSVDDEENPELAAAEEAVRHMPPPPPSAFPLGEAIFGSRPQIVDLGETEEPSET